MSSSSCFLAGFLAGFSQPDFHFYIFFLLFFNNLRDIFRTSLQSRSCDQQYQYKQFLILDTLWLWCEFWLNLVCSISLPRAARNTWVKCNSIPPVFPALSDRIRKCHRTNHLNPQSALCEQITGLAAPAGLCVSEMNTNHCEALVQMMLWFWMHSIHHCSGVAATIFQANGKPFFFFKFSLWITTVVKHVNTECERNKRRDVKSCSRYKNPLLLNDCVLVSVCMCVSFYSSDK